MKTACRKAQAELGADVGARWSRVFLYRCEMRNFNFGHCMEGGRQLLSRGGTCSALRMRSSKELALGKVLRARARVLWSGGQSRSPATALSSPLGAPNCKSRKRPGLPGPLSALLLFGDTRAFEN